MKYANSFLIIVFCLGAVSFSCFTACCQTTKIFNVVATNVHLNIVYRGIPNKLMIAVSGLQDSDFRISVTNGIITKFDTGSYELIPGDGSECVIYVHSNDLDTIASWGFRVITIPNPILIFGGRQTLSSIPRVIALQSSLTASAIGFDYGLTYKIESFRFESTKNNGKLFIDSNSENAIEEIRKAIKNSDRNSAIKFSNVMVAFPDGRKINLGDFELSLSE
jgi:hypothetical protein